MEIASPDLPDSAVNGVERAEHSAAQQIPGRHGENKGEDDGDSQSPREAFEKLERLEALKILLYPGDQ